METIALNSIHRMEGRSMQKRKSLLFLYVKQSDSKSCLFSQLNSTVSMTVRKYSILCICTLMPADIFKYNNYKVVCNTILENKIVQLRGAQKKDLYLRYLYYRMVLSDIFTMASSSISILGQKVVVEDTLMAEPVLILIYYCCQR